MKIRRWMPLCLVLIFFICTAEECDTQPTEYTIESLMLMSIEQRLKECDDESRQSVDCEKLKKQMMALKRPTGPLPPPPPPCPDGNCPELLDKLKALVLPPHYTIKITDAGTQKLIATGNPSATKSIKFEGYNKVKLSIQNDAFKGNAVMTIINSKTGESYPINFNVSR